MKRIAAVLVATAITSAAYAHNSYPTEPEPNIEGQPSQAAVVAPLSDDHKLIIKVRLPHSGRDNVQARYSGAPTTVTLADGTVLLRWNAAQAHEIAESLTEAGWAQLIPMVLSQLEVQQRRQARAACLHIETDDGRSITMTDTSLYLDGAGTWMPTQGQLAQLRLELGAEVMEAAASGGLGLGLVTPQLDPGPTPIHRGYSRDKVLKPRCGKCLNGKSCQIQGHDACCADGSNDSCTICKVCKVSGWADDIGDQQLDGGW